VFTVAGMVARWWFWVGIVTLAKGLVESRELVFWGSLALIDIVLFGIAYILIFRKEKRGEAEVAVLSPAVLSAFLIGGGRLH